MATVVEFPQLDSYAARVAAEVRAEMARKRVTQVQLAERLHLAQSAISRRVTGAVPFDSNELGIIADMLGVTVGQLYSELPATSPVPPTTSTSNPQTSNPKVAGSSPAGPTNVVDIASWGSARQQAGRPVDQAQA